jgi:hypothetical protein
MMISSKYEGNETDKAIEITEKAIGKLKQEIVKLHEALKRECPKAMKVEDASKPMGRIMASLASYKSPHEARADTDKQFAETTKIHEENEAAIAQNKQVEKQVESFMSIVGIPQIPRAPDGYKMLLD